MFILDLMNTIKVSSDYNIPILNRSLSSVLWSCRLKIAPVTKNPFKSARTENRPWWTFAITRCEFIYLDHVSWLIKTVWNVFGLMDSGTIHKQELSPVPMWTGLLLLLVVLLVMGSGRSVADISRVLYQQIELIKWELHFVLRCTSRSLQFIYSPLVSSAESQGISADPHVSDTIKWFLYFTSPPLLNFLRILIMCGSG